MLCHVRNRNGRAKIKEKLCFLQEEELLEHCKNWKQIDLESLESKKVQRGARAKKLQSRVEDK